MLRTPLHSCLAAVFILPATAATIIYQDDFSGSSLDGLQGQTTDLGAGTWTANANIKANGEVLTQGSQSAYLPFSAQSGFIYTATIGIDFDNVASGTGSLQFGFTNNVSTTVSPTSQSTSAGHAFIRQTGSAQSRRSTGSVIASVADGTYNDGTPAVDILTLVLDTTGMNWTFQAAINGNNIGGLNTYSSGNPTINNIFFGTNDVTGGTGTFSNFSLTRVPEPSAIFLSLAGGLMLLPRRRN